MKRKKLSTIILISMILVNILGCQNFKQKQNISTDTPYYSVTIGSYEKLSNYYMNVDIEMPKITYSNQFGSTLIDPLNKEIENSLNELIAKAKDNALSTYNSYLESAKANAKKDIESKIERLKDKYIDILSDEEKEFLSNLNVDNLDFKRYDKIFISSHSNMRNKPIRKSSTSNINKVNGFTNTDELIIPGLHNKNIIIVETTEKNLSETTIEGIEGKPGRIAPSEDRPNSKNRASNSNAFPNGNREKWQGRQDMQDTQDRQDRQNRQGNNENQNEQNLQNSKDNNDEIIAKEMITASNSNADLVIISTESNLYSINKERDSEVIADSITIKNFHRDLFDIYMTNIPNDNYLTKFYIPTTIHCNFEVKCLDEDYISLFVQLSESRNTSSVKRLFYNIDLNKGKIVNIKEVLGENFKDIIVNNINTEIDKWTDEQKATLIENYSVENYVDENTPFFINNNHRPVIEIEKFAITIGASGYHEFQIP